MDRPPAPLREGGQRDGPCDRWAGKGSGAGHCCSCNPAAVQKSPISARSVISKFLPPAEIKVFEALMVTEEHRKTRVVWIPALR